jgi:hypothetical protein
MKAAWHHLMFKHLAITLIAYLSIAPNIASAAIVAGIKFDETIVVENEELRLNGAGIRHKFVFKVYAAGLYLKEKKTTVADVLATPGPRRVMLTMLRDVSSEEFSRGFINGISKNTDKAQKINLTSQFVRFGQLFAAVPELKKGDTLIAEWRPSTGTIMSLNGKRMGEPYPELAFYNAILRIWLGENPVDASLKKAFLGEKEGEPNPYER